MPVPIHRSARLSAAVLATLLAGGCFAPQKRVDGRTALEQQVVAAATLQAVSGLEIDKAELGETCRVRFTGPADTDLEVTRLFTLRELHSLGIEVTRDPDAPVPTLAVHTVYAGSDIETSILGFPVFVPGIPVVFGSLSLYASETQRGRVRLAASVWTHDGQLVRSDMGPKDGTSYFQNSTFLTFIGPFTTTDMPWYLPPGEEREPVEPLQVEVEQEGIGTRVPGVSRAGLGARHSAAKSRCLR